jgi:hypothetical protein
MMELEFAEMEARSFSLWEIAAIFRVAGHLIMEFSNEP